MELESVTNHTAIPVRSSERYVILDVLRGLALLGIALANFPEFSLYSFLSVEAADVMPTAGIDRIVRYLQYIFIDGNRCFKVTGLFLLGFCIGRNRLYADLTGLMPQLKRIACYGFIVGVSLSFIYAWSAMNGRPWGLGMHAVLYFTSVFPLGFAYVAGICLCYLRRPQWKGFRFSAMPGRMALTNYIGQSVFGMLLFYGIGFGFGAGVGLVYVVLIAAGVWIVQALFSSVWLYFCQFGPLEWIWRMLTYGKVFKLIKEENG